MKPDIHPEYREIVFQDTSSEFSFLTRSTLSTNETVVWEDGNTYPLRRVEISSASHPFYTGKQIMIDSGGRVERFRRRYAKSGAGTAKAAPDESVVDESPADQPVVDEPVVDEPVAVDEAAADTAAE